MTTAMILEILLALGFWIHYSLVLLVIGTPVLVVAGKFSSLGPTFARATDFYTSKYPVLYSFTITAGIVPLLFLQVLTHRIFYQAMINLRWLALSSLVVMVLVFYAAYIARARPRWSHACAAFSVVGLTHVILFFTSLRKITLTPSTLEADYWSGQFTFPFGTMVHHFGSAVVSSYLALRTDPARGLGRHALWPFVFSGIFTVTRELQRWRALPRDLEPIVVFDGSTVVFVVMLIAGVLVFRKALTVR